GYVQPYAWTVCTDNVFARRTFAVEDFMLQRTISFITATLTLGVAPVALRAQADGRPTTDRYTIAGAFGGLSRPDRLNRSSGPASSIASRVGASAPKRATSCTSSISTATTTRRIRSPGRAA